MTITTDQAWEALRGVPDPEVPALSVVDLGIIRGIETTSAGIRVDVTPTYSGCPAMEVIEREIGRGAMATVFHGRDPDRLERAELLRVFVFIQKSCFLYQITGKFPDYLVITVQADVFIHYKRDITKSGRIFADCFELAVNVGELLSYARVFGPENSDIRYLHFYHGQSLPETKSPTIIDFGVQAEFFQNYRANQSGAINFQPIPIEFNIHL